MSIVKCPSCQQEIENDSFYCDQCGETLNICPSGHGFKKGKICNECGTTLIAASNSDSSKTMTASTFDTTPHQVTVSSPNSTDAEKTIRPGSAPVEPRTLVNSALGACLDLKDGGTIGRRTGEYTHVFGNQNYVSGTHARLQKSGNQWMIVDLASTNGTFLNGIQLAPNTPTVFRIGDTISFYDLHFNVE
jgi:predicted RNA-binding Zn-ribbon protein involved in translation (DUF1610 family)